VKSVLLSTLGLLQQAGNRLVVLALLLVCLALLVTPAVEA
jgi:hypothetical protein